MKRFPLLRTAVAVLALGVLACWSAAQPPVDADWDCNAVLVQAHVHSDANLGAAQGASLRDGKLYVYGDVYSASPRVGVIREYTLDLKPTGRVVWLRKDGKPLLLHPTGLTFDEKFGTFLGDTIIEKAVIYRLDWERMWKDGHLDNAVLAVINDDAAVRGCRPEFVTLHGKRYLATADYGAVRPELRLLDVAAMLKAGRTSAPGVVVHRVLIGPFNQNLHWDEQRGEVTCVQNVVAGLGWRLDVLRLDKAVADGRAWGPGVRVRQVTLPPHSELEGYKPLSDGRALYVTSDRKDNLVVGTVQAIPARQSPRGHRGVTLDGAQK
jgi:hypothetical protein